MPAWSSRSRRARGVEPRLFETSARDPLVLGAVVVVLELVALLAGWVPARRAVSVSPTEALRAKEGLVVANVILWMRR